MRGWGDLDTDVANRRIERDPMYIISAARAEDASKNKDEYIEEGVENLTEFNSLMERSAAIPMSPQGENMKRVFSGSEDTIAGTVGAILSNPGDFAYFIGETAFESTPQMAAALAATVVTRSPAVGAMVMGAGTMASEYGSSASEYLQEQGVVLESKEDAIALLNNTEVMQGAAERGIERGAVIAAFELLGQGVAARQLMKSPIGDALIQTTVQMVTGGGGEAAARAVTGQEMSAREIIIEALAEGVTAPVEVGMAAIGPKKGKDDSDDTPDGGSPSPDSSESPESFTGLRLTPDQRVEEGPRVLTPEERVLELRTDQRTDVGLVLRSDQRVDAAPLPPSGPLGRAAQSGAAPLSTAFDNGQMVNITTSGGMDMNAQFIQETPTGILVEDPTDGSRFEIPREEIERGDAIVTPAIAPTAQALAPEAGPIADAPMAEELAPQPAPVDAVQSAETTHIPENTAPIPENTTVIPENGAGIPESATEIDTGPVTMQQEIPHTNAPNPSTDALMPDIAKAQEQAAAGQPTLEELAGVAPEPETKRDGTPFATETAARQALKNRRLDPDDFDVVPKDDGFVAVNNPGRPSVGVLSNQVRSEEVQRPQGKPEQDVDAPMSVEDARDRLSYAKSQARSNGWSKGLVEIKRAAEAVIAADEQSAVDVVKDAIAEGETPAPAETKRDGTPFSSEKTAQRALSNRRLKSEGFDIVSRDGGFVAVARAENSSISVQAAISDSKVEEDSAIIPEKPTLQGDSNAQTEEKISTKKAEPKQPLEPNAEISQDAEARSDQEQTGEEVSEPSLSGREREADRAHKLDGGTGRGADRGGQADIATAEPVREEVEGGSNLDGFTNDMPSNARGRAEKVLGFEVSIKGKAIARRDLIRQRVDAGAVVEKADGDEVLVSPDGARLTRKAITKTGMDYAKHLVATQKGQNTDTTKAEKQDMGVSENPATKEDVEVAAAEADAAPTDAQKEAGNYQLGHITINGLDISIENAKGSERSGKDADGEVWSVTMPAHYGYIKQTEGADGDHVDVYIGDNPESDVVLVVDQVDLGSGKFDEHKVILGANDAKVARAVYEGGFSDGKGADRIGGATEMTVAEFKEWLEAGDQSKPMVELQKTEQNIPKQFQTKEKDGTKADKPADVAKNATTQKAEKIEDFGEVLEGAAKHYAAAYGEKMKVAGEQDTKAVPLSKSWPVPDYQKLIDEGADPWAVSFARAARDEVPTKPRGRYARGRLANWVKQVETLRKFSEDVMSGKMSKDKVKHGLLVGGRGLSGVGNRVDLYVAVGHEKSLAGVTLSEGRYGVYDGVEHNPPLVMWTVSRAAKATAFGNMPFSLAKGATKEEAIAAFKKNLGSIETQPKASKQVRFSVYSYRHRKGYIVGKKIGRQHVDLATFDTSKEAREYLAENEAELIKKLEAYKSIPSERKASNSPRIGEDHRGGVDATAELFAETFGFRGVQFGNYVEGKKRQADLNRAFDALMDMAGVLDIPAKAVSLNGTLGLAFGARGKGGKGAAAAHFEPDSIVINLTKKEGAGSLAHEWWHGADNYFSRIRRQSQGYLSESPYKTAGRDTDADLRQEIADAFKHVRDTIRDTEIVKRSSELDKRRTKGYWATGRELTARSFESYMISKLSDNGLANDYLANIVDEKYWNAEEALTGHEGANSYPYPTEGEQKAVDEAYDALFKAIETKEMPTGVAMLSRGEPVAILSGKELGENLNIRQLRKAALDWYRENLSGDTIVMEQTGWKVQMTNRSAKKTTVGSGSDLLRMVPAIREIIAQGRLVESQPDKHGRKEVLAVHKIASSVSLNGTVKDVIVTVREMKDGHFHYDLSRDNSAGARFSREGAPTGRGAESPSARSGIRVSTDTLNLYLDEGNIKDELLPLLGKPYRLITNPRFQAKADEVKLDLIEQLQKIGIANRIKVEVADNIMARTPSGVTVPANGFHTGNTIGIALSGSLMTKDVMNHESIHALRDPSLWRGREYGLFTKAEWQTLVAHARKDKVRMAKARRVYNDLDTAGQIEEAIADIYAEWADANIQHPTKIEQILQKMQDFFEAVGNALRGHGFQSANDVFRTISEGEIGKRQDWVEEGELPYGEIKLSRADVEKIGGVPIPGKAQMKGLERKFIGDQLTQRMAGKGSLLALVPGRSLFTELGRDLPSAQKYLTIKEEMDAVRNEWHGKTNEVAQEWRKLLPTLNPLFKKLSTWRLVPDTWQVLAAKQGEMNAVMMDLMHDSTLAQVDPSKPFAPLLTGFDKAMLKKGRVGNEAPYNEALEHQQADIERKVEHAKLAETFNSLRPGFKKMFNKVRDTYRDMDDAFDKAIVENLEKAMGVTLKGYESRHADEIKRIRDDGLTGAERSDATSKADKTLANAKGRAGWGQRAKIMSLRKQFESNKIAGPYFPLARFGQFFVTVRDAKSGKIKEFARFERVRDQTKAAETMRENKTNKVEVGTIIGSDLRDQVDPSFVAEIEQILDEGNVGKEIMDQVWQKWLEGQPDFSVRLNKIHRKGTPGFSNDAFRAFGHQVFHASHQLARLKYNLDLSQALEDAKPEVEQAKDPVRAGLVLEEMGKRHKFTLNPTGSATASKLTSFAFIWQLGASPAAALVNMTQTTIIGIPILGTFYGGHKGMAIAGVEITKAAKDFTAGKGHADKAKNLTKDERAAMNEAYRRSVIDATQAHDIAGVAESGVEYSDFRVRWMGRISWMFHNAERFNREVTFLAAYRMARKKGLNHEEAIAKGADLTWKTHFDYQNTSKPRIMQNDTMRVLMVFRNYQINMVWRFFRDIHQSLKGATKAERKEARSQFLAITGMMALHAGVKGTWGFGIAMMLAGLLYDDDENPEEELKKSLINALGETGAALLLNGIPGTVTGTDLSARIGMPDLWFRSPTRDLEGRAEFNYWQAQMLGYLPTQVQRMIYGVTQMTDGDVYRGAETVAPKAFKDLMKSYRFYSEGALTTRGDTLMPQDDISMWNVISQATGLTSAALSERYDTNNWMVNRANHIKKRKSDLHQEAGDLIIGGERLTPEILERIRAYNRDNPSYSITSNTLKASIRGRQRASANNEYGATLPRALNDVIRSEAAPLISQ